MGAPCTDRYSLTYMPGVGTELALNDNPLGVIDGADFAAAYFRIWLGDHPIDNVMPYTFSFLPGNVRLLPEAALTGARV